CMTRIDRFVIFLFMIVAIIVGANLRQPQVFDGAVGRRPLPPSRDAAPGIAPIKPGTPDRVRRPPVAPPSPDDPTFIVEGPDQPRNNPGTAFALAGRGVWFPARPVVPGCARLLVDSTWGRVPATVVGAHPSADFAVIESSRGGPALALNDAPPELGEDGI